MSTTEIVTATPAAKEQKLGIAKKVNMAISRKILTWAFGLMAWSVASSAHAQSGFTEFQDTIESFAGGPFAIGISVLALILGALAGLAKLSAWPALVGFAIAAVFAIGPYLIGEIFDMFGSL